MALFSGSLLTEEQRMTLKKDAIEVLEGRCHVEAFADARGWRTQDPVSGWRAPGVARRSGHRIRSRRRRECGVFQPCDVGSRDEREADRRQLALLQTDQRRRHQLVTA